jgi:hypothetical protein
MPLSTTSKGTPRNFQNRAAVQYVLLEKYVAPEICCCRGTISAAMIWRYRGSRRIFSWARKAKTLSRLTRSCFRCAWEPIVRGLTKRKAHM